LSQLVFYTPSYFRLFVNLFYWTGALGRAGGGRELHPHPDQTIIAQLKNCPQCGEKVTATAQKLQSVYEKIELAPIRPIVTRIERYGGQCACCQTKYVAPVPLGMEPGSPGRPGDSKLSYISPLHSCHQLRTAIVYFWRSLWTQDFSWSNRKPVGKGKNQFRRSSKSNTTTAAAGKINLFR
ncbi:hypothetical protein QUA82_35725, partial [Microcoleus sp. F8-D3]